LYRVPELYAMIRSVQPQALISYKYGLTGDEDFLAPEDDQLRHVPDGETPKPLEVCTCMQYYADGAGRKYHLWGHNEYAAHKDENAVWEDLKMAARLKANLLLNVGPLPDGSVDPRDVAVIQAVGERLRREGFPVA
jgi:alpha-L-fucosidase